MPESESSSESSSSPRRAEFAIDWKLLLTTPTIAVLTVAILTWFGRYFAAAEVASNLRLQILLALAGFSTASLVAGARWLGMIGGGVSMIGLAAIAMVYIPPAQVEPGPVRIRVMSINVWTKNEDTAATVDMIRRTDPDVVVVHEYANHWPLALEELHRRYPHRITQARWHGFGQAIFSKFSIADSRVAYLADDELDAPMIIGDLSVGRKTLRLAGVHLVSPTNPFRLAIRNQQIEQAARQLAASPHPTLVIGDFNCAPWSPFIQEFLKQTKMRDSRKGFGLLTTWHAKYWWLGIPIDHAFVSEQLHVHDRRVESFVGSDHLPILIEVSIGDLGRGTSERSDLRAARLAVKE